MIPTHKRRRTQHPMVVESFGDLPEPVTTTLCQHDILPETIIEIPTHSFLNQRSWFDLGMQRTAQFCALVFEVDALDFVKWNADTTVTITRLPLADVVAITLDSHLLYSQLRLVWQTMDSVMEIGLEFNSVGMDLIEPPLNKLRQNVCVTSTEPAPVLDLSGLPYKFQNYVPHNLLPGEQPIVIHHEAALFSVRWYGQIGLAPNRVLVLTKDHLIVIEDGMHQRHQPYRVCRSYIPREQVQHVQLQFETQLANLILELGHGLNPYHLSIPLRQEAAINLEQAINHWSKM